MAIQKTSMRLDAVQIMRAMAALMVVVTHGFHEAAALNPAAWVVAAEKFPLWVMGVDIFFIISGFIMMHTAGAMFGRAGAPKVFMLKRLARIVPPYWFFTTLILLVALVMPSTLGSTVLTWPHAVMSYLFIPHLMPGDEASIHPLLGLGWTLIYEMFFYGLFALALMMSQRLGLSLLVASFVGLFVGAKMGVWNAPLNIFWGNSVMFDFVLGIGAYLALQRNPVRGAWLLLGVAVVGMLGGWASGVWEQERLVALGFPALALFAGMYVLPWGKRAWVAALVLVGDASYTLYLAHPFALEAVKQVVKRLPLGGDVLLTTWMYMAVAVLASVVGAVVFYVVAERPVTKALVARVGRLA